MAMGVGGFCAKDWSEANSEAIFPISKYFRNVLSLSHFSGSSHTTYARRPSHVEIPRARLCEQNVDVTSFSFFSASLICVSKHRFH